MPGQQKDQSQSARRAALTVSDSVPLGLRVAAAWGWRLLLVAAVLAVAGWLFIQVRVVAIPVIIALLVASLAKPAVDRLARHGWNRWLAVILVVLGILATVAGLFYLVVWQLSRGMPDLLDRSHAAYQELLRLLLDSPLHWTEGDVERLLGQLGGSLQQDSAVLLNGALSVGSTASQLATGFVLALFSLLFFLGDGRNIFHWVVRIAPRRARVAIAGAGRAGWTTLSSYVRVQILVAAIDAVGIGLGAFFLGLPMVLPMGILVFMASFVPFVGAIVSGAVVVIVALIYKSLLAAVIMLGIVLLVQQVESHVLQPLIMGSAVKVHPLGVVISVAVGTLIGGIPGALFAVPAVAVANKMVTYLAARLWERDPYAYAHAGQVMPESEASAPASMADHDGDGNGAQADGEWVRS